MPTATAVVIPDDEQPTTSHIRGHRQPAVWVAETRDADAQRHTWGDVANLLRTPLPWWDAGAAFFIDSHNVAWPMPYPPFPTDHDGHALAQTLTRLIFDASADVADPDAAVETNEELVRRIQTATLPFLIG